MEKIPKLPLNIEVKIHLDEVLPIYLVDIMSISSSFRILHDLYL